MRAFIIGTVVEKAEAPYDFVDGQGKRQAGVTRTVFVKQEGESGRYGATGVRVAEDVYRSITTGDDVSWPCDVFANARANGRAVLSVRLAADALTPAARA